MTRFRRPLSLFARYRVTSTLRCWDERWFYLEHVFYDASGNVLSIGTSRAAFRHQRRWVRTQEVMDQVDPGATSIPIPDYVSQWIVAEGVLFRGVEAGGPQLMAAAGGESQTLVRRRAAR